ncbi:MAG: ATP-binding protein [Deltaproteobacteria bacterium]|nr:ATP-binding protein [Deltaproteobacteria bacterium]
MFQGSVTEMFSQPAAQSSSERLPHRAAFSAARRAAARRDRALLDELVELWLVGADGELVHASPAAMQRFANGLPRRAPRAAVELIHADERADWSTLIAEVLYRPGTVRVARFRQPGRDGVWRYADARLRNRLDHPEIAALVVEWRSPDDVWTEVRREPAAPTPGAAESDLVHREMEAFCHSLTHELRAPLRAIEGFSRALLDDHGDHLDAPVRGCAERIHTGARRMQELLEGLLELAGVTRAPMTRRPVDLSAMAQAIVAELRERAPERQVEVAIEADLRAEADPRLLHLALQNLIGNAWKYTSRHSSARIEIGALRDHGAPVYFVRDDGAGFTGTDAQRLFGTFQRAHRREEFDGTGIGLATVQRIITRHGGRVWASGAVERGATFYFTLEA